MLLRIIRGVNKHMCIYIIIYIYIYIIQEKQIQLQRFCANVVAAEVDGKTFGSASCCRVPLPVLIIPVSPCCDFASWEVGKVPQIISTPHTHTHTIICIHVYIYIYMYTQHMHTYLLYRHMRVCQL